MSRENARDMKQIFHLTALDNIESIICNGLMTRNKLRSISGRFIDIADQAIIDKRGTLDLGDYVPFHFHPYTAFDYAVKEKFRDREFVYIAVKRDFAKYAGFKVIPFHPLSVVSDEELYEYDEGFAKIDWDAVESTECSTSYIKQARMAECLSDKILPAALFQNVYVHDGATKQFVEGLFEEYGITDQPPYVNISDWV